MDVTKVYIVHSSTAERILSTWWTESEAVIAAAQAAARYASYIRSDKEPRIEEGMDNENRFEFRVAQRDLTDKRFRVTITVKVWPQEVQGSAVSRLAALSDDA